MKIDTILFDFDGTLVDTKHDVWDALNFTRKQIGLLPFNEEEVTGVLGPGKTEFLELVYPDGSEDEKEAFLAKFQAYYFERCLVKTRFYSGMESVLQSLSHKTLAVASNKPRAFIEKILKGLHADHLFSFIISPEDVNFTKPHPEMVLKAITALHAVPERTLLVGDTEKDMFAGRAAGVAVCWADYGYGNKDRLGETVPDFSIQTPDGLLAVLNA